MTASEPEILFPDREFSFLQLRLTEYVAEDRERLQQQAVRRVLWDAWQEGYYVFDVVHTERVHAPAPTHTEVIVTGLAKRR